MIGDDSEQFNVISKNFLRAKLYHLVTNFSEIFNALEGRFAYTVTGHIVTRLVPFELGQTPCTALKGRYILRKILN